MEEQSPTRFVSQDEACRALCFWCRNEGDRCSLGNTKVEPAIKDEKGWRHRVVVAGSEGLQVCDAGPIRDLPTVESVERQLIVVETSRYGHCTRCVTSEAIATLPDGTRLDAESSEGGTEEEAIGRLVSYHTEVFGVVLEKKGWQ